VGRVPEACTRYASWQMQDWGTMLGALLLQLLSDSQQEFSLAVLLIMVLQRSGGEKIGYKPMSGLHPDQPLAVSKCQVFPCLLSHCPCLSSSAESRSLLLQACKQ